MVPTPTGRSIPRQDIKRARRRETWQLRRDHAESVSNSASARSVDAFRRRNPLWAREERGQPNGMGAKLRGRGRAATRIVARRLPRIPLDSDARTAADVTPRRWCSAQALQRRTEAGPCQLQRLVGPRCAALITVCGSPKEFHTFRVGRSNTKELRRARVGYRLHDNHHRHAQT
jgi:hypothetical protein